MKSEFRRLPSVDKLLSDSRIRDLESSHSRDLVVEVVRQVLEESRQLISRGESGALSRQPGGSRSPAACALWRSPASCR